MEKNNLDETHWLDKLCIKCNSNRYKISKNTSVTQQGLSNIVKRNKPIEKIEWRTCCAIAEGLGITLDQLREEVGILSAQHNENE